MKKQILLLLTVTMAVSLVACQKAEKPNTDGLPNVTESEEMPNTEEQLEAVPTAEPSTEVPTAERSHIDVFIEAFNQVAATPITEVAEIDIFDRESGHYRTEFRLSVFEGATAKSGKIGTAVLDVINCGRAKDELRIYADGIEGEQAAEIVTYAAPIMDPNLSADELQGVLDYLNGVSDYHNGYFGTLCVTFNRISGEFMLRTD